MSMNDKLKKDIEQLLEIDEGNKLKVYKDVKNIDTVGIGFALVDLSDEEKKYLGIPPRDLHITGITQDEDDWLFNSKLQVIYDQIEENLSWFDDLSENRQLVVLSVIFNIGFHGFLKFKHTIACIASGDFEGASKELLNSDAARELPKRYGRLSNLLKNG